MEYSIIKAMLGQYLGNIAIISRHPFFKGGRMKFDFELQGGGLNYSDRKGQKSI